MDGALHVVRMDPPSKSVQTARACGNRIVRTLNAFSMNISRNKYKIKNNLKSVEQHRRKSLLVCNSIGLGVEGNDGSDGRKDSGDDPCFAPAFVSIDNNKNPNCTVRKPIYFCFVWTILLSRMVFAFLNRSSATFSNSIV